jgi:hypothetical protein
MQGGILKKNITRGIPKQPYFAEDNSYLTLYYIVVIAPIQQPIL